jgi:hypothetical protein
LLKLVQLRHHCRYPQGRWGLLGQSRLPYRLYPLGLLGQLRLPYRLYPLGLWGQLHLQYRLHL